MEDKYIYLIIVSIIAILLITLIIYETNKIDIKHYLIENKKVYKQNKFSNKGIKIVYFSDLHIGRETKKKQLIKRLRKLKDLNANIYIFGGDLIGTNIKKYYSINDVKECFEVLKDKCLLAVYGNHEFKKQKDISNEEKLKYFNSMGFKVLENEEFIYKKDNKKISFYGMQENIYHDVKEIIKTYDIVLSHQGDIIDNINNVIMLSGHTHGGQIRLPLFPLYYRPKNGKKYTSGLYKVNNSSLIVSNGLGYNAIKLRFFARCDIIVIDYIGE